MLLKLTIAYDGTRFGGWQIQPNADTIQGRIEEALAEVALSLIHISEPTRLGMISYAVFCLKKKK